MTYRLSHNASAYEGRYRKCPFHHPIHLCYHLQWTMDLHPKVSVYIIAHQAPAIYSLCPTRIWPSRYDLTVILIQFHLLTQLPTFHLIFVLLYQGKLLHYLRLHQCLHHLHNTPFNFIQVIYMLETVPRTDHWYATWRCPVIKAAIHPSAPYHISNSSCPQLKHSKMWEKVSKVQAQVASCPLNYFCLLNIDLALCRYEPSA